MKGKISNERVKEDKDCYREGIERKGKGREGTEIIGKKEKVKRGKMAEKEIGWKNIL